MKRARLRPASVAAALICAVTVAGCSSSGSSPAAAGSTTASRAASTTASPAASTPHASSSSGSAPATASPSSATAGPACAASALRVKLGLAQGYAGGTYQTIDFTNTSSASCTLYGYPGVSLASGPPHTQIGLAAKRGTTPPARLVTLTAGGTASSSLQIVDAQNYPPSSCRPVKATELRIYPPNQTVPVYLAIQAQGCAKPVQILTVSAVQAGSGGSS